MTRFLTILTSASRRYATKRFTSAGKMGVELARSYRCRKQQFSNIFDLHDILSALAQDPFSFVIRGEPIQTVDHSQPVRRLKYADGDEGPFFRSVPNGTRWLCFDFDGIECPKGINPKSDPLAAINYLCTRLPSCFHDVTCSWQWSSSAGLDGWKFLHAHLWFVITESADDDVIRSWARDLALPIDLSPFNTVQPHFTANPIFDGANDPIENRNGLLIGTKDEATVDFNEATQTMRRGTLWRSMAEPIGARSESLQPARQILAVKGQGYSRPKRGIYPPSYRAPRSH